MRVPEASGRPPGRGSSRGRRGRVAGVAAWLVAGALLTAVPLRAQDRSGTEGSSPILQGVYTEEQARRGEALFRQDCSRCHSPAEFSSERFRQRWTGRPLFELFGTLAATMPLDRPASLTGEQYAALIAYVLERNGYPPGERELGWREEELSRLRLASPASAPASPPEDARSSPSPAGLSDTETELARLRLAGPAKRYCSGIWVSGREPEEALRNSVLLGSEDIRAYEEGRLRFETDRDRRIVTASREGVSARARHFGDQGCVILPPGSDDVFFTPRKVESALPDAESLPWPMGDRVPDEPLPEDVDEELLSRAVRVFFSNPDDRRAAFLVVYRGRLVAEQYGSGAHRDMQLESWSMGKSMTATFIGRLIQLGHVELWEPAPVPEWRNTPGDPRGEIRIADLLRMSSGLRFTGSGAPAEELAGSSVPGFADHLLGYAAPVDVFRLSTSRPLEHPPNTVGRYRNSDPWTLGYVVRRTVENLGEEYLTWPQRALFDRIGIRRFVMETDAYGNFILTGYNFGTARDWARAGLLYLQEGMWEGERLLPQEFVEFVSTPAPAWDGPVYGGLFWVNRGPRDERPVPTLPEDAYWMAGAGDQRTFVVPSRDLVIVAMNHRRGSTLAPDANDRLFEALELVVRAVDPTWSR